YLPSWKSAFIDVALFENNVLIFQHITDLLSAFYGRIPPPCRIYCSGGNIKTGEKTMDDLLNQKELLKIMKISRSTLWRVRQEENFPKPMMVLGCKRWCQKELQAWLDQRAASRVCV